MTARTELEITWDGPIKGLADHRVSLTHFGEALNLLMVAARRIASNAITSAMEPADTGRVAKSAKNLDIEIAGMKEGSGGFHTLLTFEVPDSQILMFNELPEKVGIELLESIRVESEGTHRNAAVRNFLRALPQGLARQTYNLHENGRPIKEVFVGKMTLPPPEEPLPALMGIRGRITGVGFEPGRSEVRIKGEEATQVNATATEEQVNKALALRSSDVSAIALSSAAGIKLLAIDYVDTLANRGSAHEAIFRKWADTFRALA